MAKAVLKRPLRPQAFFGVLAILFIFTWAATFTSKPNFISQNHSGSEGMEGMFDDEQKIRKEALKSFCKEKVNDLSLHSPNYVRRQVLRRTNRPLKSDKDDVRFVFDPSESQLAYCHVPKAASTTWMLAMASINNVSLEEDLDPVLSIHDKMLKTYGVLDTELSPSAIKFTFIRHPFERIVSCYHDKFVNRLEKSFLQPVIDWEAGLIGRLFVEVTPASSFLMTFEKFVNFVIYELESNMQTYGSLHWWPYTRLCGLCHVDYDFVGRTETLQSDLDDLTSRPAFRQHKKVIDSLFAAQFNKNEAKTEKTSRAFFSQLSAQTTERLYGVYADDFKAGGYEYPKEYIRLAKDYTKQPLSRPMPTY